MEKDKVLRRNYRTIPKTMGLQFTFTRKKQDRLPKILKI